MLKNGVISLPHAKNKDYALIDYILPSPSTSSSGIRYAAAVATSKCIRIYKLLIGFPVREDRCWMFGVNYFWFPNFLSLTWLLRHELLSSLYIFTIGLPLYPSLIFIKPSLDPFGNKPPLV